MEGVLRAQLKEELVLKIKIFTWALLLKYFLLTVIIYGFLSVIFEWQFFLHSSSNSEGFLFLIGGVLARHEMILNGIGKNIAGHEVILGRHEMILNGIGKDIEEIKKTTKPTS